MLKPNIGIVNALIRITAGLTFLSYGTAQLVKKPWRQSNFWLVMLSAMKVGEGIVRYCPVTAVAKSPAVQEKLNLDKIMPVQMKNDALNEEEDQYIPLNE